MTAAGSFGWRRLALVGLLAGTAILIAAAGVFWLFQNGLLRFNYPSAAQYPVQGIDVSHHQGTIDWHKVASNPSLRFAVIKATEGGTFTDPGFADNWRNARRAGIATGAYHYFTFCRPGAEQAANYLATVPLQEAALPATLDLEFGGNCDRKPPRDELIAELRAFLDEVRKTDPRQPIFYVTPEFFSAYLAGGGAGFPDHHLWVRNIFAEPDSKPCVSWSIWQFASNGRVAGISGPVDLNVFCGGSVEFAKSFTIPASN
jgi:lysozyme